MRQMRKWCRSPVAGRTGVAVGLVAALALAAGCGGESGGDGGSAASASDSGSGAGETFKVAWLWYGPKNDGGYNVSQWRAQAAIKEKYGDRVEQIDVEKVPY